LSTGGEEAGELWGVVAGEKDRPEGEVGVESAGEAGRQHKCWLLGRKYGADGLLGVALAHAGEEDLDVGTGGDCGFEGSRFLFYSEANDGEG
jgi:hypothetical protein